MGKRNNFTLGQLKVPKEDNKLTVMDYKKWVLLICSHALPPRDNFYKYNVVVI